MKFVSDFQQVGGFLWNIVESSIEHNNRTPLQIQTRS
jgi:hypothetical protein